MAFSLARLIAKKFATLPVLRRKHTPGGSAVISTLELGIGGFQGEFSSC